jgi:hypothetical protein
MAMDQHRTLKAYERAWAQSDEAQIRAWLTPCWTTTSTYVNAFTDTVSGLDGLTRLILDYPVLFPDAQITPRGEQEAPHHQHARFRWRLSSTARIRILGKDFGCALDGLDFIEFNRDSMIKNVVAFFGCPKDDG